MNELDAIDLKILSILQKDGRITTLQLAERVGLSPTPCARRVRHLETEGFISQYVAVLNASKLNAGLDVFVSVRLRSQATAEYEKFERRINDFDEVVGCYLLAGNFDYLLHVKLPDVGSIAEFTRGRLNAIDAVSETQSIISVQRLKQSSAIPLWPAHKGAR
jgi:Lrp/AsnC family leucine-responsive transcriptional regulator